MPPFVFTSDHRSSLGESTRLAEVPGGLDDKAALLSWYSGALDLPAYYGSNWDALEECLRDLSWIKERKVVIYHRDVPLIESSKDQTVYISLLRSVVEDWKHDESREFIVAFDPSCEMRLRALERKN